MIVSESSVVIDRPVPDVFAFVADPMNEPRWHHDVAEVVSSTDETLRLGTRLVWDLEFMGREEYTVEVTDLEPDRRIELTTRTGRGRPKLTHRFEPNDDATRYTRRVEIQPEGVFRVLQPMMRRMAPRRNARWANNLKDLLER